MPSQVIRRFTYNADRSELDILFVSERLYRYHEVPAAVFLAMQKSFSKGEFFNANIRDRYDFTRLSQ